MTGKKILFIEDEADFVRPIKISLEQRGFSVVVFSDGESGAQAVKIENPDIVMLDLVLPKINGFEVLKIIKSDEKTKNIPVIVLSNLSREDEIKKCLDLGAKDFLVKTRVSIKETIDKISSFL